MIGDTARPETEIILCEVNCALAAELFPPYAGSSVHNYCHLDTINDFAYIQFTRYALPLNFPLYLESISV